MPEAVFARTFKVSRDADFAAKVCDIVGLYLNPPEKAVVLCVDEESQIQALDRRQPGLPMKKGRAGPMTYDYKRHGTTTLFAGLDIKTLSDADFWIAAKPAHDRLAVDSDP